MTRSNILLLILIAILVSLLSWWFRPWATYSPSIMTRLFHPEYRLENFRRMENIFPYRVIAASNNPFAFPVGSTTLPEYFIHDGSEIETAAFLDRTQTTGLMVVHQGISVLERYFQAASHDDRFTSWSVAKTVVGTLTAIALKEGHIRNLSDRVSDYVPELANEAWGEVRIEDLLRMASGIDFSEIYDQRFSDINVLFYRTFLLGQPVREVIAGRSAARPPGEAFHYISPNTQILAWVLERAVGQPISAYAAQALWQPLGMQDDAIWSLDQSGVELGFCCLNMTLRDYAKLGQLYLQQGRWRDEQLLPENWVQQATRRPEPWLAAGHGFPERGYGYHVWVPKDPDEEYFFNGVWGQTVWISEKHQVVIAKTSVDPLFREHMAEVISFMRAVSQHTASPVD
jgi:CubicO group peptidase (beta-lactamase class C family)